jgi:hypothetical protein
MTVDIMAHMKAAPNMFPDTVQVRTPVTDGFGKATSWTNTRNLRARVVGQHSNTRTQQGQDREPNTYAIFDGSYGLTKDDEYTLPARFSPQVVKATNVEHYSDEVGAVYDKVTF